MTPPKKSEKIASATMSTAHLNPSILVPKQETKQAPSLAPTGMQSASADKPSDAPAVAQGDTATPAASGVHGDATVIPSQWTFKDQSVADNFDKHVREQLPWYDMATQLVQHFGRHYLPRNGRMYDVGASTGNITRSLKDEIESRNVQAISIDNSEEMAKIWRGVGTFELADVETYQFKPFDFAVCFLILMFLSPLEQQAVFQKIYSNLRPGGAMLVFEKVEAQDGYLGTVFHRLTIQGKVKSGVAPEDIVKKELSLSGMQRPLKPDFMKFAAGNSEVAFRFGEFVGWVVVR